jgi:hypothetical protein
MHLLNNSRQESGEQFLCPALNRIHHRSSLTWGRAEHASGKTSLYI